MMAPLDPQSLEAASLKALAATGAVVDPLTQDALSRVVEVCDLLIAQAAWLLHEHHRNEERIRFLESQLLFMRERQVQAMQRLEELGRSKPQP